jgi:hypothetical protein
MLAGCGRDHDSSTDTGDGEPGPVLAELADQATQQQVSESLERGDKEVERLIKEGQAAGIEKEVRAAVGRLVVASNERLVVEGDLKAATWFEQQVTGKTAAQLIAAFPEK